MKPISLNLKLKLKLKDFAFVVISGLSIALLSLSAQATESSIYADTRATLSDASGTQTQSNELHIDDILNDLSVTQHSGYSLLQASYAPTKHPLRTQFSTSSNLLHTSLAHDDLYQGDLGHSDTLSQLTLIASNSGNFKQNGRASWYGGKFHGRKTASGERYDMHAMTAAHKSLPFNTYLKVTNQNNGKSVVVKVNDRGPYAGNRILDLSFGAAKKIGMVEKGVVNVKIEKVAAP